MQSERLTVMWSIAAGNLVIASLRARWDAQARRRFRYHAPAMDRWNF
jgi:hypothetical protein